MTNPFREAAECRQISYGQGIDSGVCFVSLHKNVCEQLSSDLSDPCSKGM